MAPELHTSRSQVAGRRGRDQRWLVGLVDVMQQAASPELRNVPCDAWVIAAVTDHLARPATTFAHCGSAFSLRN